MNTHDERPADTSRRTVLEGLGALGVVSATAALPLAPVSAHAALQEPAADDEIREAPADFLALSAKLTGIPLDNSYIELGNRIWTALTPTAAAEKELRTLFSFMRMGKENWETYIKAAKKTALAGKVALIWYTGAVDFTATTGGERVITYDNALAWRACTFTKPPANCGGPFGYWHDPA